MKYKVGDRVKIKSLDWYNENKDAYGIIIFNIDSGAYSFTEEDVRFCGQVVTIEYAGNGCYLIAEDDMRYFWIDEMIECKVEEEIKPNIIEEAKTYWDSIKDAWICPEGYIFTDENGNVINAKKIVLEKGNKYPKTYEECCKVLGIEGGRLMFNTKDITEYEENLIYKIGKLEHLIVYRDAYWKIAGEEMGLGKPWEPDWNDDTLKPCIGTASNEIIKCTSYSDNTILSFPTVEMRDAFKENFDPDIEICKELL